MMTYVLMCLLLIIFIGVGLINYRSTCRTANKLIELYGDELH